MEPPVCALCDRDQRDHPDLDFDTVAFRDHQPLDGPGHPEGLMWFCQDHLCDARGLRHLDSLEAVGRLRRESKISPLFRLGRRLFRRSR